MEQNSSDNEQVVVEVQDQILPQGKFPTWGDILAILGIFLVSQLVTMFIFSFMGLTITGGDEMASMDSVARRYAEFQLGRNIFIWSIISQPLMLLLVLIYRTFRGGKWRVIRCSARGFDPTILLWGVIMLFSVVVVIEPLMSVLPQSSEPAGRGIYMLMSLLFVAPVFEELLCRGVILEAVRGRRGAWAACVVSSLVFGFMHMEPQFVLNAFVIGLILGFLYLRTNSIFAPIIVHSINNLIAYLLLIFGLGDSSLRDIVGDGMIYAVIYVAAVLVLVVSIVAIMRHVTRLDRGDREVAKADIADQTK